MPRRRKLSDVDYVPILASVNTCSSSRKKTSRQCTKKRASIKKSPAPKVPRDVNDTIIVLDDSDDDCVSTVISRSRKINENVKNKVEDIFKSSGLLSDEEDDAPVPYHTTTKTECNDLILSSIHKNEPSSSTCKEIVEESTSRKVIVVEDDLNEMNTIEDIKNYCEETEDILKNANAALQKFAGITSQAEQLTKHDIPDNKENAKQEKKLECPICYENLSEKQVMTTKCGHLFCKSCIERVATTIKKCPSCRKAVNKKNIIPIYI